MLGEDFGFFAEAYSCGYVAERLRPLDVGQVLQELQGFGRGWRQRGDAAYGILDFADHFRALRRVRHVAAECFFDHALDHGDRECYARRFDRLEIDGGEEMSGLQDFSEVSDIFAFRGPQGFGGVGLFAEKADRGECGGDISERGVWVDAHYRWAKAGAIHTTDQGGVRRIFGQSCGYG